MAINFHPLPLEPFTSSMRPYVARLNRELRELFSLESMLRSQARARSGDGSIVLSSDITVSPTRIEGFSAAVLAAIELIGITGLSWAIKASSQSFTNTTLADVTGLSFALTKGVTYWYDFRVLFGSSVATTGIVLGVSFGTVNYHAAVARIPVAPNGVDSEFQGALLTTGDKVIGTGVSTVNQTYVAQVSGILNPSSTTFLQLMAHAEITATTITIQSGSIGQIFVPG